MAPMHVREQTLGRPKTRVVVQFTAEGGGAIGRPGRPRSPGLDLDRAVAVHEVNGGGAVRGVSRAPGFAVPEPQPRTRSDRRERQRQL